MRTPKPHGTRDRHDPGQLSDDEWFEHVKRVATPPTNDQHNVITGLSCPPTRAELQAFVDREQERIRRELGLLPPS